MKFSIGIPAYKGVFFEECLNSLLQQNYSDFEIIIVDDASPDNLIQIVEKFQDKRIQYYRNDKNIGAENVVDNWNRCLQYAKGEYFLLMGDDDKLSPFYLERFAKYIEKYPLVNVFHCRTAIINQQSEIINLSEGWPEWESMLDNIYHRLRDRRVQFISDFVYKTSFLNQINGFVKFPLAWNSDDVTAFEAADRNGIVHINEILFYYRTNPYNISTTGNWYLKAEAMLQKEKWIRCKINSMDRMNKQDQIICLLIRQILFSQSHSKVLQELSNGVKGRKAYNLFQVLKEHKRFRLTLMDSIHLLIICLFK